MVRDAGIGGSPLDSHEMDITCWTPPCAYIRAIGRCDVIAIPLWGKVAPLLPLPGSLVKHVPPTPCSHWTALP